MKKRFLLSALISSAMMMSALAHERRVAEARRDRTPYPSRAIRTSEFLLIRNFKPKRMPMGEVYKSEATAEQLLHELRETGDPRVIGDESTFDRKPFVDPAFVPPPRKKKISKF